MTHKLHVGRATFFIFVLLLTLTAMLSTSTAAGTPAPEAYFRETSEDGSTFYFVDKDGNPVNDAVEAAKAYRAAHQKAGNLPATYDARDYNLVTPVKHQGTYGNCWAFAATSVMETNAIKKGLFSIDTADFSELHLAWFAHNPNVSDTSDPTYGDGSNKGTESYNGGNYLQISSTYMRGSGPAKEADFPYTSTLPYNLPESGRYNREVLFQGCYRLDTTDNNNYSTYDDNDIKQAILDYGSVQACYFDNGAYYNTQSEYAAYYNNVDDNGTNHAVTIVGWDDNFPRTNFKSGTQPSSNGAWIVKNSWGDYYMLSDGYMYISYEDVSLGWIAAYETQSLDAYDNIYTYSGIEGYSLYLGGANAAQANVFTAEKAEILTKVGFYSNIPGTTYKVNIYTDIPAGFSDPSDGNKIENVASGTLQYEGYYTVDLANSIELAAGETYAVELVLINGDMQNLFSWEGERGHCLPKQSFGLWYGTWYDSSASIFGYTMNNALIFAMTEKAHIHEYMNPVVTSPTCTEQGFTTLTCFCGKTQITDYTTALGHAWSEYSYTAGNHTRSCTRIGCSEVESGNCTYGTWTVTTPAACTAAGSREKSCTVCADKITETVTALGHDMSDWTDNNGTHTRSCTRTGCTETETVNCSYGNWVVTLAATCTATGIKTRTCSVCGGTETQSIPSTGHDMSDWFYSNGTHIKTCSNTGCTYKETANCTYGDWTQTLAPTCTAKGSENRTCSVCNGVETREIAALGHDMSDWANNDGTHSRYCTREGCNFTESADCSYGEWIVDTQQTCTTAGSKHRICTVCGDIENDVPPALGHNEGEWIVITDADCTNDGTKERQCTRCNFMLEIAVISATGHTPGSWTTVNEATCESNGLKQLTCTVCHDVINIIIIPANGHTPGAWDITKAATCTEAGTKESRCKDCGVLMEKVIISAKGHTAGTPVVDIEATCMGTGVSCTYCTDCNIELSSEIIPVNPNAHLYGEWQTTRQATCTADGESSRSCTLCNASETRIIAKTSHTDAANDGYCDICGAELYSHEEPAQQTFIQKIAAFFQKIADFFKKLFGG